MKTYDESIKYMKAEMKKQTEAHRQPYRDAIAAMEICNLYGRDRHRALARGARLCDTLDLLSTLTFEPKTRLILKFLR